MWHIVEPPKIEGVDVGLMKPLDDQEPKQNSSKRGTSSKESHQSLPDTVYAWLWMTDIGAGPGVNAVSTLCKYKTNTTLMFIIN